MGDVVPFDVFGSTAALVTDTAGRLCACNPAARKLLGVPATCPLAGRCWEVVGFRTRRDRPFCGVKCPVRRGLRSGDRELRHRVLQRGSHPQRLELLTFVMPGPPPQRDRVLHLILPEDRSTHSAAARDLEYLGVREREILNLLANGSGTKEIAAKLCISVVTVRNHVQHILQKLKVHSRSEAVTLFWRSKKFTENP